MTDNIDSSCGPTSIVAIGVGNRMRTYMNYVANNPRLARLVAVVEPDDIRRNAMADKFGVPEEYRFNDYNDYFNSKVRADVAFICTPEREHYEPCMKALETGHHVLLEKPIAQSYEQCLRIHEAAEKAGKIVYVCHILRYHPVFLKIKEIVSSGRFGRLISINHTENVGIERTTHSYVRGSMNTEAGNNPMLLAKCCHDIDFLLWIAGSECRRLSSFGSRIWFRKENAPEGSAERCVNCSIERNCPYSAVDLYWRRRQWINNFDVAAGTTIEHVITRELESGRFGRCVFHCDNDLVDNQVLTMQMGDGALITLCMDAFTLRDGRLTDIKMTGGEIVSDGIRITVVDFATRKSEVYDFTETCKKPFHAGADHLLVESFLKAVHGVAQSSSSSISDSLPSHKVCFEAERSRKSCKTIEF